MLGRSVRSILCIAIIVMGTGNDQSTTGYSADASTLPEETILDVCSLMVHNGPFIQNMAVVQMRLINQWFAFTANSSFDLKSKIHIYLHVGSRDS